MRHASLLTVAAMTLMLLGSGCSLFDNDTDPSDRELCMAVLAADTQEFLDNDNVADFDELENDQDVFLFVSSLVDAAFDGSNVIELISAVVDFDFEDEAVDPGDLGGFFARWRIVMVPFTADRFTEFQAADSTSKKRALLDDFLSADDRIESLLSGPFLENDCEWGDTDEIGTQELTYLDYAIYDWDFFAGETRILGIIFEGDEEPNQHDIITLFDISENDGTVMLESADQFRIELLTPSDVTVP